MQLGEQIKEDGPVTATMCGLVVTIWVRIIRLNHPDLADLRLGEQRVPLSERMQLTRVVVWERIYGPSISTSGDPERIQYDEFIVSLSERIR